MSAGAAIIEPLNPGLGWAERRRGMGPAHQATPDHRDGTRTPRVLIAEGALVGNFWRRCRFCNVRAPGGEVPVWGSTPQPQAWHVCGRCWGFLDLGLRERCPVAGVQAVVDGQLRLRQMDVRAAIRTGLEHLAKDSGSPKDHLVTEARQLLAEFEALLEEIEASRSNREPSAFWSQRRAQIAQLRERVRVFRDSRARTTAAHRRAVPGGIPR